MFMKRRHTLMVYTVFTCAILFEYVAGMSVPRVAAVEKRSPYPAARKTLIAKKDLPLYGRRILYTTPRNYAGKLGQLLIEHGALPVWMPTIVVEPLHDYRELDQAIKSISDYDWIAFTSRNGIEAFLNRCAAVGAGLEVLRGCKTAAIGSDARALEKKGIAVDLIPFDSSPLGIVDELVKRGAAKGSVLLPVPEVVGMKEPRVVPDFIDGLLQIGMRPVRVPAYRTARETQKYTTELQMIRDGTIDSIAFTSRGEIESLLLVPGVQQDMLNEKTIIACFGPVTAEGARQRGLDVKIVSKNYAAFEGFIEAMEQYYTFRNDGSAKGAAQGTVTGTKRRRE